MSSSENERPVVNPAPSTLERLRSQTTCTIEQASQLLQVGRSTAYAAAHDGSLPVVRISHRLLVSVPRLLAMLGVEKNS
ncbi:MAG: helix-turn-helix domain-containing protein [Thermoleophilia bacterium]